MHNGLRWQAMKQKWERLRDFASWCRPGLPALCCTGPWPHWPQAAGWPAGAAGPRAPCLGHALGPRRSPAVSSRSKDNRELGNFICVSGAGGSHHGFLHWSWRPPIPGGPSGRHKEVQHLEHVNKIIQCGSFRFSIAFFGFKTLINHFYF